MNRREPAPDANVVIVSGPLYRVRTGHGWKVSPTAPPPEPEPVRRPARVAQMLALAHHLQASIDQGHCRDRADLARTLDLTRARITQLLDLTLLAPDIQEELLFLEAVDGAEPLSTRALRPIARRATWREQREAWRELRSSIVP